MTIDLTILLEPPTSWAEFKQYSDLFQSRCDLFLVHKGRFPHRRVYFRHPAEPVG